MPAAHEPEEERLGHFWIVARPHYRLADGRPHRLDKLALELDQVGEGAASRLSAHRLVRGGARAGESIAGGIGHVRC